MKTLYVHIGTPKTGTTSIQIFCNKNKEVLAKKGFCFPDFPYRYTGKRKERNGAFLTSVYRDENDNRVEEEEQRRLAEGLDRVSALFREYDHVVLTDEGIWTAVQARRESLWAELKEAARRDGYRVKVIVYLRRQDDFAISSWNQRIKTKVDNQKNITHTWEEFVEGRNRYVNLDYWQTLECAAAVLGKENIIVRRYERSSLKDGLAQVDFLDALGLELTDEYEMDVAILNEKLSLNGCEMKRVINEMTQFINMSESRFFEKVLLNIAEASNEEYPCVLWSAKDAKSFVNSYEEDNRKIVDTFIQDGQPLFHDHYRDGEVWKKDNPHMGDDIVRFAAMSHVSLLKEIQGLKKQIKKLQGKTSEEQFPSYDGAGRLEAWWEDEPYIKEDMIRFVAMSDMTLLREIQGLKKQIKTLEIETPQGGQPLCQDSSCLEKAGQAENDCDMGDDILCFAAMSDLTLLRGNQALKAEIQELKRQNQAIWRAIEGLRMFRMKVKHPLRTAIHMLSIRGELRRENKTSRR